MKDEKTPGGLFSWNRREGFHKNFAGVVAIERVTVVCLQLKKFKEKRTQLKAEIKC